MNNLDQQKGQVEMARSRSWQRKVFELGFVGAAIFFIVQALVSYRTSTRMTLPLLLAALALFVAAVINSLLFFASKQTTRRELARDPTKAEACCIAVVGYLVAISALLFAVVPGTGTDIGRRVLLFGGFLFFGIATTLRMFTLRKRWRREGQIPQHQLGDEM